MKLFLPLLIVSVMLIPLPAFAGAGIAGTYQCFSFNVDGIGGDCPLAPPIVLHDDGTYDYSGDHGTYQVEGDRISLSRAQTWGPGKLQNGNRIVFHYQYNGKPQTVTYLCQQCSYTPSSSQGGGYGAPPQQGNYGTPPSQNGVTSRENYGSPPQQGNYGTPPQQNGEGSAGPQGSYGTPPQQGNYGAQPQPGDNGGSQGSSGASPSQNDNGQAATQDLKNSLNGLISSFKSLINSFKHKQPQDQTGTTSQAGSGASDQGNYAAPASQSGGPGASTQDNYGTPPPQTNGYGTPPQ